MVTVIFKGIETPVKNSAYELTLAELSDFAAAAEIFSSTELLFFQFSLLLRTSMQDVVDGIDADLYAQLSQILLKINTDLSADPPGPLGETEFNFNGERFLLLKNFFKFEFGRYVLIDNWLLQTQKLEQLQFIDLSPLSELAACILVKINECKAERFSELEFEEVQRRAKVFYKELTFGQAVGIYNFFLTELLNYSNSLLRFIDPIRDPTPLLRKGLLRVLGG